MSSPEQKNDLFSDAVFCILVRKFMIGSKLLRQSIKCSQKLLPPVTLSNLTQMLKPGRRQVFENLQERT